MKTKEETIRELVNDRHAKVFVFKEQGKNNKEIGEIMGVSRTTISNMMLRIRRVLKHEKKIKAQWYFGLSSRARHPLLMGGCLVLKR